jgi:hypothetical protein
LLIPALTIATQPCFIDIDQTRCQTKVFTVSVEPEGTRAGGPIRKILPVPEGHFSNKPSTGGGAELRPPDGPIYVPFFNPDYKPRRCRAAIWR